MSEQLWVVEVPGFRKIWVYAETRGKAISPVLKAVREAGYKYKFTALTARKDVSGLPPLPGEMLNPMTPEQRELIEAGTL